MFWQLVHMELQRLSYVGDRFYEKRDVFCFLTVCFHLQSNFHHLSSIYENSLFDYIPQWSSSNKMDKSTINFWNFQSIWKLNSTYFGNSINKSQFNPFRKLNRENSYKNFERISYTVRNPKCLLLWRTSCLQCGSSFIKYVYFQSRCTKDRTSLTRYDVDYNMI